MNENSTNSMDKLVKKLQYDCMRRILPSLPISTMKKICLLLVNPKRVSSIKLTPEEVLTISDALCNEMDVLSQALNNPLYSQILSCNARLMRLLNAVAKAEEVMESISSGFKSTREMFDAHMNSLQTNLDVSNKKADYYLDVVRGSMVQNLSQRLETQTKFTETLNKLIVQRHDQINKEISQAQKVLAKYEEIENFHPYLEEYDRLIKHVEELKKVKLSMSS